MVNRIRVLIILLVFCGFAFCMNELSFGHHIWIAKSKETGKVNIYFGEGPAPDQDVFLAGIKGMQVWSVDQQGLAKEISITHKTQLDNGWFETKQGLSAVEANCEYGVFGRGSNNMFLHYCAKWVEYSPGQKRKTTGKLPTDILMSVSGSKTTFKVIHKNRPAADCELQIVEDNDLEHDLVANKAGEIVFDKVPSGRWMLKARVVEAEPGEFQGKKYVDKKYFCTMVIDAPITVSETTNDEALTKVADEIESQLVAAKPFPELPLGITSFGGAVANDHVYVFGGHCGDAHDYYRSGQNSKLMRLNLKSPDRWENVSESTGLQGLAMIEYRGQLYRVGGFEARNKQGEDHNLHSVDEFARFNFDTNKWETLTPMPSPRSSLDAVVIGDELFVVGGWTMRGDQKTRWCDKAISINLADEKAQWKEITMPFVRRALSVGFQGDKLYAVGGMQKSGGPTTNVKVYDLANKKWTDGPALPGKSRMAGFGSSCFNIGGKLIVSTYDGNILRLKEDQTGWEKLHQLETGRFFHRLLPLAKDKFLLVGGANMESGKTCDVPTFSFN